MPKSQDSKTTPGDILIVDDETANLKLLEELLIREGYQVRPADLPQLAIDSALAQPPALILLDVRMPEMDGFEVCRRLKQDERTRDIPVIFVSALQDVQDKVRGFETGGIDFITKPFQEEEVLARVRTHLTLRNMQLNLEEMVAKRTAEAIERGERFRATFEQAAVGVAHVSPDGKFLRLNQKFCDIIGYTHEELIDLTFQDITHPDDLDTDLEYVRQVLEGEIENYSMDKRYYRKDGSIVWTNLTVSLVTAIDDNPKYFVSVIKDITERKQAEQKILEYQQRLKALASQLTIAEETERRRIAADLHDHVGQTLALIRLQIASVRELNSDPDQNEMLNEISESLRQTVQETRDLIYDLSPPQLNEIGLSAAILEWLEEHVEKRYEIKTECISNGPEQQLDKNLRSILFRNTRELVFNVIKHSHATQVKIRVLQDHNHMEILVKDNGIGFDAGAVSLSLNGESSFGLFSIKERMADMGGSLEIVSEPGQGTKAIMHVPLEIGKG